MSSITPQRIPIHRAPSPAALAPAHRSIGRRVAIVVLSAVNWLVIALLTLVTAALVAVSVICGPTPLSVALLLAAGRPGLLRLLVLRPTRLQAPVFFLLGRHDVNAPPSLAEADYGILQAPLKALIWFERSGHDPWGTEAPRVVAVVVNRALTATQPR
jgi:pimeloyl-ACP methyl ester carboxylesterase